MLCTRFLCDKPLLGKMVSFI